MTHFTEQRDHALMAALIYRAIQTTRPQTADALIQAVTSDYGLARGKITRENTLSNHDPLCVENYFAYKSLKTKEGVFEEHIIENGPNYITEVTKCCWVDTWIKYGLIEHGRKYCICCDPYMAKGYDNYDLTMPAIMTHHGSPVCRFVWKNRTVNQEEIQRKKDELQDRYVMSWNDLTHHLMDCALNTLEEKEKGLGHAIIARAQKDYDELMNQE